MIRGRSVSKKRSIRGKSRHGSILRQPCRCYLRGTCARMSCEYWHPLESSVCFRITRLKNNQIKSWRRATFQKEEKATTRMLWLLWKVCRNWVVYHKLQMHSFLKVESLGKTRYRKSWNDSLSLRYVMRVSAKKKGPSHGQIQVKILSQNLRADLRKRLNDKSDAPEARSGTLLETFTCSKKKTRLHSTFLRRNGYFRLRQQKSWRKDSL